jgi:hypothetical protein
MRNVTRSLPHQFDHSHPKPSGWAGRRRVILVVLRLPLIPRTSPSGPSNVNVAVSSTVHGGSTGGQEVEFRDRVGAGTVRVRSDHELTRGARGGPRFLRGADMDRADDPLSPTVGRQVQEVRGRCGPAETGAQEIERHPRTVTLGHDPSSVLVRSDGCQRVRARVVRLPSETPRNRHDLHGVAETACLGHQLPASTAIGRSVEHSIRLAHRRFVRAHHPQSFRVERRDVLLEGEWPGGAAGRLDRSRTRIGQRRPVSAPVGGSEERAREMRVSLRR